MAKKGDKNEIDYSNISIPDPIIATVDHSNYTFEQRRAEILQIILKQGYTDIPNKQLAKMYGVSYAQISHDKNAVVKFISERYFNKEKVISEAVSAQLWALRNATKEGDHAATNRIAMDILKMGYDLQIIDKAAEKHELSVKDAVGKILRDIEDGGHTK